MSLSVSNSLINKGTGIASVSSTTTKSISSSTTSTCASSTVKTSSKATASISCSTTITSGKSASNSTISYIKSSSTTINTCSSSTSTTSINQYKATLISSSLHTEKGEALLDKDNVIQSIYDTFSLESKFKSRLDELIGKDILMSATYNIGEYTFYAPGVSVRYFSDVTVSEISSGSELITIEKDITNNIKDINSFVNNTGENLKEQKYIVNLDNNYQLVHDGNNEQHLIVRSNNGLIIDMNITKLSDEILDVTISKEDAINDNITTNTGVQYIIDLNDESIGKNPSSSSTNTSQEYVPEVMPSFWEFIDWEEVGQDAAKAAIVVVPVAVGVASGAAAGAGIAAGGKELLKAAVAAIAGSAASNSAYAW